MKRRSQSEHRRESPSPSSCYRMDSFRPDSNSQIANMLVLQSRQLRDQLASRAVSGDESLDALSGEDLAGIDVALRIGGDHVQAEKLAAAFAHAAQSSRDLAVVTIEEPDRVVLDVADVEV